MPLTTALTFKKKEPLRKEKVWYIIYDTIKNKPIKNPYFKNRILLLEYHAQCVSYIEKRLNGNYKYIIKKLKR